MIKDFPLVFLGKSCQRFYSDANKTQNMLKIQSYTDAEQSLRIKMSYGMYMHDIALMIITLQI